MIGLKDARGGATPTTDQQPHPQDPTPQRDCHIMRRTGVQGQEATDRIGKGGGEAEKRNAPEEF